MTNVSANASYIPKVYFAVAAVGSMLLNVATGAVAQTIPANLPAAIICYASPDQSWRVAYLFRVDKSDNRFYITPDGRLTATVNAKGVVEPPTNRPGIVDCYGKTVDELRSSGRILEFQPKK